MTNREPDDTPCTSDGQFCTGIEWCQDGACLSPGDPCDPDTESCDENANLCLGQLDLDGDGQIEPLTDGLLFLRYLFGFRGSVLITGAYDTVNCTRCTAGAIESYIGSLL